MADFKNEILQPKVRSLAVASYNIHKCRGWDFNRNVARIAQVIDNLAVDVIGLQEVHSVRGERQDAHQADYFARTTGFEVVAGPTIRGNRASYGNLLLTRCPILSVRHIDLSMPGREPRGAIDVDLDVDGEIVRVVVTHLGLRAYERVLQMKRLLSAVADGRTQFTVLLGDLNEWHRFGGPFIQLEAHFGKVSAPPTFPSLFPALALDRIFVSPREAVMEMGAHASSLARIASDHLPVKAILRFG